MFGTQSIHQGSKQDIQELDSLPQSGMLQSRKMVPISQNPLQTSFIVTIVAFVLFTILGITLWSVGAVQSNYSLILAGEVVFGIATTVLVALIIASVIRHRRKAIKGLGEE
jgi:uncharacterized membrane protein